MQSGNSRFLMADSVGRQQGTAILELESFGGRPSWKATRLQLQSGNEIFSILLRPIAEYVMLTEGRSARDLLRKKIAL